MKFHQPHTVFKYNFFVIYFIRLNPHFRLNVDTKRYCIYNINIMVLLNNNRNSRTKCLISPQINEATIVYNYYQCIFKISKKKIEMS